MLLAIEELEEQYPSINFQDEKAIFNSAAQKEN